MPRLAAETLVAVHETILARWKEEKPEQLNKLAPPVKKDPVYRPLAPSPTEETFYRERRERIKSLPRYRVRDVSEMRKNHICAHSHLAEVEDTHRMSIFTRRVSEILRCNVDWPDEMVAYARKEIPTHLNRPQCWKNSGGETSADGSSKPSIIHLLPRSTLGNTARIKRVDEYTLYRALDDLQSKLIERVPGIAERYPVEKYAADHVVFDGDQELIADLLAGYDEQARAAVALAHAKSYPTSDEVAGIPLHVACSPDEIHSVSERDTEVQHACSETNGK